MKEPERHYSAIQAAELLGVHIDKVLRWIHSGELVARNLGNLRDSKRPRWRIAASDLDRFLVSRTHPASSKGSAPAKRSRKSDRTIKFF